MGLIIKNKITTLMKGYPTVSDKYDVAGGILEGATDVYFGDPVMYGSQVGYYKAFASASTVADFAGFVLATNVKVPNTYPASTANAATVAGEAFNLFFKGYIAVKLTTAQTTVSEIAPGKQVIIKLADGTLGTASSASGTTLVALPNAYFTGIYLQDGKSVAAVACVAAASTDTEVVATKTYYTRASSSAGAGYLNDGTYAYTKVASPTGNPSTSSYYEVSVLGSNAIVPNFYLAEIVVK